LALKDKLFPPIYTIPLFYKYVKIKWYVLAKNPDYDPERDSRISEIEMLFAD
jgi:hypothetical protein